MSRKLDDAPICERCKARAAVQGHLSAKLRLDGLCSTCAATIRRTIVFLGWLNGESGKELRTLVGDPRQLLAVQERVTATTLTRAAREPFMRRLAAAGALVDTRQWGIVPDGDGERFDDLEELVFDDVNDVDGDLRQALRLLGFTLWHWRFVTTGGAATATMLIAASKASGAMCTELARRLKRHPGALEELRALSTLGASAHELHLAMQAYP